MIAARIPEKPASASTSTNEQTVDYFIGRMTKGDFYILCPDNDVDQTRDRRRVEWSAGGHIQRCFTCVGAVPSR